MSGRQLAQRLAWWTLAGLTVMVGAVVVPFEWGVLDCPELCVLRVLEALAAILLASLMLLAGAGLHPARIRGTDQLLRSVRGLRRFAVPARDVEKLLIVTRGPAAPSSRATLRAIRRRGPPVDLVRCGTLRRARVLAEELATELGIDWEHLAEPPSRRFPRFAPLLPVVVLGWTWVVVLRPFVSSVDVLSGDIAFESSWAAGIIDTDLELKVAGVLRYAQAHGRLPRELREARLHVPTVASYLEWQERQAKDSYLGPQLADARRRLEVALNAADPTLDPFGLPPVIVEERPPVPEWDWSWRASSADFSPEVTAYLEANGGVPPRTHYFVLHSLPLAQTADQIGQAVGYGHRAHVVFLGGLLAGLLAGLVLVFAPPGRIGWAGASGTTVLSLVSAGAIYLFNYTDFSHRGSCYAVGEAPPEQGYDRAERLRMLEDAVKRGEVDAEAARAARRLIGRLPDV